MKPSSFWLEQIKYAFLIGKIPVIRDGNPKRLHRRLYRAARVRHYNYRFAQADGGVVVKRKGEG